MAKGREPPKSTRGPSQAHGAVHKSGPASRVGKPILKRATPLGAPTTTRQPVLASPPSSPVPSGLCEGCIQTAASLRSHLMHKVETPALGDVSDQPCEDCFKMLTTPIKRRLMYDVESPALVAPVLSCALTKGPCSLCDPSRAPWHTPLEPGVLSRALRTPNCALCALLAHAWHTTVATHDWQKDPTFGRIFDSANLSVHFSVSSTGTQHVYFSEPADRASFSLWYWNAPRVNMRLLADDAHLVTPPGEVARECARMPESQVNRMLLKAWYKACLCGHSRCAAPKKVFPDDPGHKANVPVEMRLLDVQRRCVVDAPPGASWVALSYVWAGSNTVMLEQRTKDALYTPGGLDAVLSDTVQDALEAVEALEERYLWVDALCIFQDSEADKEMQILQMDAVYSSAALTIVAASVDAEPGLPGWRASSRPERPVFDIQGQRFVIGAQSMRMVMQSTPWSRRGWTWQEHLLSSRLMIFSEGQSIFACQSGIAYEDVIEPFLPSDPSNTRLAPLLQTDSGQYSGPEGSPNMIASYSVAVSDYTARKLSFDSDAVNAAAGVLSRLGDFLEARFVVGLPEDVLFEWSLVWIPWQAPERRREEWPTWAWAGWIGQVEYPRMSHLTEAQWGQPTFQPCQREVEEWMICAGDGSVYKPGQSDRSGIVDLQLPVHLCFATRCITLERETTPYTALSRSRLRACRIAPGETGVFKIFAGQVWVGAMTMIVPPDAKRAAREPCDLVLLSSFSDKISFHSYLKIARFDSRLGHGKKMYHVMLVEWKEDVAVRVGVGHIHERGMEGAVLRDVVLA
ncbi:HET-domain-containing protein [Trichodelitschia bisporula]|uniref:HET-domain-containing protein n=1 Tax=Trichodelitschia bisporula TaxID=703511 RepID=A0A6G1I1F3_9PEZI|nr:HET-domain-containing protein [Trichodelitschia bisporula]